MREPSWIVSQIGAREHYAVPRGLYKRGQLHTLYTDVWAGSLRSVLKHGPAAARSVANRYHTDLAGSHIVSFNFRNGLVEPVLCKLRKWDLVHQQYLWTGQRFASAVRERIRTDDTVVPHRAAFFSYNTGCLETLHYLNDRGIPSVLGQIDPARLEQEIVLEETRKWPGWADDEPVLYEPYFERIASEWDAASMVLVNSEWSRTSLIAQGVPPEKLVTVPLAYEPPPDIQARTQKGDGPLKVLWLGQVVLRKGIQYLVEAARQLPSSEFEFTIAGPIGISEVAQASAPPNVRFVGRLTREQTAQAYAGADVFVLPTLSDGFAITQLEAMAHGLPVVATRRCGDVVTDGVDGLIVEAGSADSLASTLTWCQNHRDELIEMGGRSRQKLTGYTLDAYAGALHGIYNRLTEPERIGSIVA